MTDASGGPAAFLDRDGVINVDHGYVHRVENFDFMPGALGACRDLHVAGYKLVVITNQAGIAHGFYDEAAFAQITDWMKQRFIDAGAPLTGVYYCPHHPGGKVARFTRPCDCRKPAPGMILQAARDHRIDLSRSFLVGDKESDLEAAVSAGVPRRFLIGAAAAGGLQEGHNARFSSLAEVVRAVLEQDRAGAD